jgi:hypothetical protein
LEAESQIVLHLLVLDKAAEVNVEFQSLQPSAQTDPLQTLRASDLYQLAPFIMLAMRVQGFKDLLELGELVVVG